MSILTPSLGVDMIARWDEFTFRHLTRRSGDADLLREIVKADPDLAVGRALAALIAAVGRDRTFDAEAEIEAARRGRMTEDWERSFVAVVAETVDGGLWAGYDGWQRHADTFPGDLLGLQMAFLLALLSTGVDSFDRAEALVGQAENAVGQHQAVLGRKAMLRQEQGRLDEAHGLAELCLAIDPTGFDGAHPLTHVYFEAGEHSEGVTWLDSWLPGCDQEAEFRTHLVWHAALHDLQLGNADSALKRYRACAGHSVPPDGTSLLWRCQLLGHVEPGHDPATPTAADIVAPLTERIPFTFLGAHVVLGLATARDVSGLRRFASAAEDFSVPGAAELLPDLAHGYAAYVEGDFATASVHLLRRSADFVRLGGSHAQREVFEDTLIYALIGAGRLEEASRVLQARLDRRPSPLDSALLARARPSAASGVT